MSHTLSFDPARNLITVATAGALQAAEFVTMIAETGEAARAHDCRRVLVNHAHATVRELNNDEIRFVADTCVYLNPILSDGRLAVLMHEAIDFGLGRMWLSFTEGKLSYESQIFRQESAALAWVLEG